jgi:hypothetical protein
MRGLMVVMMARRRPRDLPRRVEIGEAMGVLQFIGVRQLPVRRRFQRSGVLRPACLRDSLAIDATIEHVALAAAHFARRARRHSRIGERCKARNAGCRRFSAAGRNLRIPLAWILFICH